MEYQKIESSLKELGINSINPFETSNFFTQQKYSNKNDPNYIWKNELTHSLPYQRVSITEYSKVEKLRIENTKKWFFDFMSTKTQCGKNLPPVEYFAIPIEFQKMPVRMQILLDSLDGNFYPMYLSSIQSTNQLPVLALFYREKKVPRDFSFIRIEESTKTIIPNSKLGYNVALIVEQFIELNYDKIYLDIPDDNSNTEKRYVSKILKESFPTMNVTLQSPILSSPGKIFSHGGVALTYENKSDISTGILNIVQRISPPQYRIQDISSKPFLGNVDKQKNGIPVRFAERPYNTRSKIRSVSTNKMLDMEKELQKRRNFAELSVVGQYNDAGRTLVDLDNSMRVFSKTEINFTANDAEEFGDEYDFERTLKLIDPESLHVNIVKSRACCPSIPKENQLFFEKMQTLSRKDMNGVIEDIFKKDEERNSFLNKFMENSSEKMQNIAASISRSDFRKDISTTDIETARGIICDSIHSTFTKDVMYEYKKEAYTRGSNLKKRQFIIDLLYNENLSCLELWEYLKNSGDYNDIIQIQNILNELSISGEILYDRFSNKYKLIKI